MQHIANIVGPNMLHAFGRCVAMYCDMLGVVGSSLKMIKCESITPNMSQHGGQTHLTCCTQQCWQISDSTFGQEEGWSSGRNNEKNRNKPWVSLEPRLAHGRMVEKLRN